jgi:hypothetical protein
MSQLQHSHDTDSSRINVVGCVFLINVAISVGVGVQLDGLFLNFHEVEVKGMTTSRENNEDVVNVNENKNC